MRLTGIASVLPLMVVVPSSERISTLSRPKPEIQMWLAAPSPVTRNWPATTSTCTLPLGTVRSSSPSTRGMNRSFVVPRPELICAYLNWGERSNRVRVAFR